MRPLTPMQPAAVESPRTVWQVNADAFAARQPDYIDQERNAARRRAMDAILAGRPGYALFILARSVERQQRIAGLGRVELPVCPKCGRTGRHLATEDAS